MISAQAGPRSRDVLNILIPLKQARRVVHNKADKRCTVSRLVCRIFRIPAQASGLDFSTVQFIFTQKSQIH